MSSKKFFCIRGYMKSGTNWVCRILNQHPDIDCIGEFHWETFFRTLQQNVSNVAPQRRERIDSVVRPELELMVKRCLESLARPDTNWIGDRTPTTIAPVVMTEAPHIVVVRDFRDVIVSRMFHLYNHPRVTSVFDNFPQMKKRLDQFQQNRWHFRDHPEQLLDNEEIVRDSAREWSEFLDSDLETCRDNAELPVLHVSYEQLHANFESESNRLFAALGLKAPDISNEVRPGHEVENPDQPNRKGQIGDWKNYLNDNAKRWIQAEAGTHLQRLGYIQSADW